MNRSVPDTIIQEVRPPLWVAAYLLVMFLATCASGLRVLGSSGVWTLADWLINYTGGFVRRGLPGALALGLHHLLHLRLPVIVVGFAMCLYLLLFVCLYRLAAGVRWKFWTVAAFLSPVTVAYPFVSTSGYHKEVFFLAAFAALLVRLLHLRREGVPVGWKESAALTIAGLFGVLSHELFAIYFPYVLAGLYLGTTDWRRVTRVVALPIAVISLALALVATHPGTPQLAQTVCDSLGAQNHTMCAGSIDYLGHTRAEARAETLASVEEYHYWSFLPLLTVLGLVPIVASFRALHLPGRAVALLVAGVVCAGLLSVLLFVYGADWGRWLEIHLFSIFLLLLFSATVYRRPAQHEKAARPSLRLLQGAVLLIYATCWSLPGTTSTPTCGYVSMFGRVGSRALHR